MPNFDLVTIVKVLVVVAVCLAVIAGIVAIMPLVSSSASSVSDAFASKVVTGQTAIDYSGPAAIAGILGAVFGPSWGLALAAVGGLVVATLVLLLLFWVLRAVF